MRHTFVKTVLINYLLILFERYEQILIRQMKTAKKIEKQSSLSLSYDPAP